MPHTSQPLHRRAALRASIGLLCGLSAHAVLPSLSWAQSSPASASRSAKSGLPKIVAVGGAITECVYALGAQAQLVGTDTTSVYPSAAQNTPKVGYMRQLSAEGLLSLKPDALIASGEAGPPAVIAQIRAAGVRVDLLEADHSWAEVQRKLLAVGEATQQLPRAQALLAQLDSQWAKAQAHVAAFAGKRPRALFILAHGGAAQVAGMQTAANAMLGFAGAENVMRGFSGYRPMTAEAMAAAAPEIILTSTQGLDAMGGEARFWERPELALTPAYRRRALVHMDALELLGFGPRMPATVLALSKRMGVA
ncbi:heme/hemin ABC transporter substrate-binding protein [Rhodoferax aquaticus]|uniref:ABC transporter substrate-binding protein n=1 Tax=Rhodoferax aquaticus TaxID=2527691 RepID=A0A515ENI4_9BURK|nr:ABC transporter substrate-binding protein [Rhodoferax aquaticus]QDL54198.1 ABC transporter substrate-binding protein [Rhodoferax aquaticus]